MICAYCGKEGAKESLITETIGKGESLIIIEDVPIIYCPNCGESYLTAETLHQIEAIRYNRRAVVKREVGVAHFTA
ncbi:MAG: type II toxin-antitoxin system MqsA family antitoxin [Calditrichota bacterium]